MSTSKQQTYQITLPLNYDDYPKEQVEYLKNRVLDQIIWYDKKAAYNQKMFKKLSIYSFCISASIPVFTIFGECFGIKIVIALLGAVVSVISYIINICTYKDLWVQYRMNCEMLKSEISKFANKVSPYNTDTAFSVLVENCEQYFTKEFSKWQNNNQSSTNS